MNEEELITNLEICRFGVPLYSWQDYFTKFVIGAIVVAKEAGVWT